MSWECKVDATPPAEFEAAVDAAESSPTQLSEGPAKQLQAAKEVVCALVPAVSDGECPLQAQLSGHSASGEPDRNRIVVSVSEAS